MSVTEAPGRFGRPPKDRKAAARLHRLTEQTVMKGQLLACNHSNFYLWMPERGRWVRLVPAEEGIEPRANALRRSQAASTAARARWGQ